jgi:uncharacterized membrane protein required for colicin V production
MWFSLVLIGIFAVCLALLYNESMWNNALRLVNVVTAALLATNFYEPVASWLDAHVQSCTYFWDFIALWVLFGGCVTALRALTDEVSKVNVRFLHIADRIGGVVFAVCIGWVLLCFTAMSLHTAPLARDFFFGSFKPEERLLFGLAPDRQWLGFVQRVSRGQFSQSATSEQRRRDEWKEEKWGVFDPRGEFLLKYAARRTKIENQLNNTGGLSVDR